MDCNIDLGVITLAGNHFLGHQDGYGTAAQFNYPTDIVVDPSDMIFVNDAGNFCIRQITPTGENPSHDVLRALLTYRVFVLHQIFGRFCYNAIVRE